ncbi:MAG: hypothetical protein ABIE84_00430, partial [bacterium]
MNQVAPAGIVYRNNACYIDPDFQEETAQTEQRIEPQTVATDSSSAWDYLSAVGSYIVVSAKTHPVGTLPETPSVAGCGNNVAPTTTGEYIDGLDDQETDMGDFGNGQINPGPDEEYDPGELPEGAVQNGSTVFESTIDAFCTPLADTIYECTTLLPFGNDDYLALEASGLIGGQVKAQLFLDMRQINKVVLKSIFGIFGAEGRDEVWTWLIDNGYLKYVYGSDKMAKMIKEPTAISLSDLPTSWGEEKTAIVLDILQRTGTDCFNEETTAGSGGVVPVAQSYYNPICGNFAINPEDPDIYIQPSLAGYTSSLVGAEDVIENYISEETPLGISFPIVWNSEATLTDGQ